jgi:hypothetical protein
MRPILHFLPLVLIPMALPVLATPPASPAPSPGHLVQAIRPGQGRPRVRDTAAADAASRTPAPGPTRPYQAAKPGEGAPKT